MFCPHLASEWSRQVEISERRSRRWSGKRVARRTPAPVAACSAADRSARRSFLVGHLADQHALAVLYLCAAFHPVHQLREVASEAGELLVGGDQSGEAVGRRV